MRRILVLLFLGCSPAQKPIVDVAPVSSASAETLPIASAAPSVTPSAISAKAMCPATFGSGAPRCTPDDNPGPCDYPEGRCFCGHHPHCGGAAPIPTPPIWICERPRTPCPAAGTACTGNATCSNGPCSWSNVVKCLNGKWTPQRISPPP